MPNSDDRISRFQRCALALTSRFLGSEENPDGEYLLGIQATTHEA